MARNVEDLALLLDAMSGEELADPRSLPAPPTSFLSAARSGAKPKRIAYSADFGITPVDPEVAAITRKAAARFAEAGVIVEEAHPDLSEAHECFHVLRALSFAMSKTELLRTRRDQLKPEVIWNIEAGLKLTVDQIARAQAQRLAMTERTLTFFETYDLLLSPATIVAPFPVENRYVAECGGKTFSNYIEWLAIAYAITLTCAPAMSLPCGFTASGLPVGLQIVGPLRGEARLLAGAKVLEDILGIAGLDADRSQAAEGLTMIEVAAARQLRAAARSIAARETEQRLRDDVIDQLLAADIGDLAGEQALLRQHDDAMQRGPDLQRVAFAQMIERRRIERIQHQRKGLLRRDMQFAVLGGAGHGLRGEHQAIDAAAFQAEHQRRLRQPRQLRALRRLRHRLPQGRVELTECLGGHGDEQRLAIGKMPIRRGLRHAERLRQRLDADRFRAAAFRLTQRSLDQRIAKIAVMIAVARLAGWMRHMLRQSIFRLDMTSARRM